MLMLALLSQLGVVENVGDGKINWTKGIVSAKGYGVFDPNSKNVGAEIVKARRAAIVVAQRNLLETVKGVHVTSETIVKDYMLKSDIIITRVQGTVRNARIVDERIDRENGIVEVELAVNLEDIAKPIYQEIAKNIPKRSEGDVSEEGSKFSALVLDASSSNSKPKPSLLPKIYDENGNLILDLAELIDPNDPRTQKVIRFVNSINDILNDPELRDNPLVIKIVKAINERDIVVDREASDKLKWLKTLWKLGKKIVLALF